jgi:3'-phosphoadenosine 5'-phosphosulfate sulfotransferase (PAPS reductase)/FAD synthetase
VIGAPACISFSGGRTSGYMLKMIWDEHGAKFPADVIPIFANTGKERSETLDFVHAFTTVWGIPVRWVEYRPASPFFEEVSFETASRSGEPFASLIAKKGMPPNWQARFCTQALKVETMARLMASLGYPTGSYVDVIGLRHDEGRRLLKMYERNDTSARRCIAPLDKAKITVADIAAFWRKQPFDVALNPGEGNCDLCFLKGRGLRKELIRRRPNSWRWWSEQELSVGGFFDRRAMYASLASESRHDLFSLDEEHDVECGLLCAAE